MLVDTLTVVSVSPRAMAALSHSLCVEIGKAQLPLSIMEKEPAVGGGAAGGEGGVIWQRHRLSDEQLAVLVLGKRNRRSLC